MRFEKKVVHILAIFIFICIVAVTVLTLVYGDPQVLKKKKDVIQFFIFLSLVGISYGLYRVHSLTRKDRQLFIKSLLNDRSMRHRTFEEFHRLRHAYEMERHFHRMNAVEKQHLDDIKEYNLMEYQNTEKNIYALEHEIAHLLRSIENTEYLFISMANNLDEYIWVSDGDGVLTFVNNYLLRKMRVTVGDHISGVFCLEPEDCSFFFCRDFKNMVVRLWDADKTRVQLSSARVFLKDRLHNVIFHCKEISVIDDIIKRNQDFNFIFDTFETLSKNVINKQSIENYLERMCIFGEFKSASIRLLGNDKTTLDIYTIYRDSVFVLNKEKLNLSKSHMGLAYRLRKPVLIHSADDMRFDEPILLNALNQGLVVNYFPLCIQDIDIGILSIISDRQLNESMILLMKSVCINLTIALEKILIYDKLKNNFFDIIGSFFMALEMKSKILRGHSSRVAMICKLIAEQLYYSGEEIDSLYSSALLHDVGKLLFVDKSYKHVFDIHEHGYLGRMIMERVGASKEIIQGIEHHHDDYRSEKGVQPIFPQFIRLANDFDTYFHINPIPERANDFILRVARNREGEYSPNLVNVLEYLIENDFQRILKIYEVTHA